MTYWQRKKLLGCYETMAMTLPVFLTMKLSKRDRAILLRVIEVLRKAKDEMVYGT